MIFLIIKLYLESISKDYFITYFNMNQASLIRKKDMDKGTVEKLRSLYQNTMDKKYKRI